MLNGTYDQTNGLAPFTDIVQQRPYRKGFTFHLYESLTTRYHQWVNSTDFARVMDMVRVSVANRSTRYINGAKNPSPQLTENNWSGDSGGATSVVGRMAGVGVNGGFGYRQTWLTDAAGPYGYVTYASADGNRPMPVTGGEMVYPSAYVGVNKAREIRMRIAYFDSGSNFLSEVYGSDVMLAANALTRLSIAPHLAPATATHALIAALHVGSGERTRGTRTNLATNPSVETALTNWQEQWYGAPAGAGASTRVAAAALFGSFGVRKTWSAVSLGGQDVGYTYTHTMAFTAGQSYTFSGYTRQSWTTELQAQVTWLDASSVQIGATVTSARIPATANTWYRPSLTVTAPTGAAFAKFSWGAYPAGAVAVPIGATADFDGVLIEQAPDTGSYFDGSTVEAGRTSAWTGTANASTSTRSGDTLTMDRVSTAPGDYFDGSTQPPVGDGSFTSSWEGAPYDSRSLLTGPTLL